ncbi:MAG: hypothetical protein WAZ18_06560 [Alphaproteobacteria bacterium]
MTNPNGQTISVIAMEEGAHGQLIEYLCRCHFLATDPESLKYLRQKIADAGYESLSELALNLINWKGLGTSSANNPLTLRLVELNKPLNISLGEVPEGFDVASQFQAGAMASATYFIYKLEESTALSPCEQSTFGDIASNVRTSVVLRCYADIQRLKPAFNLHACQGNLGKRTQEDPDDVFNEFRLQIPDTLRGI